MKSYPSIAREYRNTQIIAFDKLDGSNIRVEWTKKSGFSKFGSRTRLLDPNEKPLGESVNLFMNKYSESLSKIFIDNRWQKTTSFFEFYGKNSFAGNHENEEHFITLFDVSVDKKGLLEPRMFLKLFKNIDYAPVLYEGNCNSNLIESVKSGNLLGMTCEGIVCKGNYISPGLPLMFKIKSDKWIEKLKHKCKDNEELFNKLL